MTTTVLSPSPIQKFFDNNGVPLSGGKVQSFAAGTNTPLATYPDSTDSTPNPNPLTLNFRGEAQIWLPPNVAYKLLVTDAAGNTIPGWPVDNIVNSQLITLYGGVDTGTTNAYLLNFTANFTSLTDGVQIVWIPSHSNTGASTINVNGLGVVNITNQDGSALYANQLVANQFAQIIYKGGAFVLLALGPAAFNAQRTGASQSMAASAVTDCVFNTASINQGGAYNTTTGIFTAPAYGIYSFAASVGLVPGGTNCVLIDLYFSKNNDTGATPGLYFGLAIGTHSQPYSNTGNTLGFAGSAVVPLNAGDTMRVKWSAGTSGAGTNAMGISSSFSGAKVA